MLDGDFSDFRFFLFGKENNNKLIQLRRNWPRWSTCGRFIRVKDNDMSAAVMSPTMPVGPGTSGDSCRTVDVIPATDLDATGGDGPVVLLAVTEAGTQPAHLLPLHCGEFRGQREA